MNLQNKIDAISLIIKQAKESKKKKDKEDKENLDTLLNDEKLPNEESLAEETVEKTPNGDIELDEVAVGQDASANAFDEIINFWQQRDYDSAVKTIIEHADKAQYGKDQWKADLYAEVDAKLGPDVVESMKKAVADGLEKDAEEEKEKAKAKAEEAGAGGQDAAGTPDATPADDLASAMQDLPGDLGGVAGEEGGAATPGKNNEDTADQFMENATNEEFTPSTNETETNTQKEAAFFSFLTKAASINSIASDMSSEELGADACGEYCTANKEDDYIQAEADPAELEATGTPVKTLQDTANAISDLLKQAYAYKQPESQEEIVLKKASAASSAEEWLNSISNLNKKANLLDEKSNSPEHPGKKMFNGDYVTHTSSGETSPKFPGQKVFATRDGGNAQVESVFDVKGKPEVDVYNPATSKKNIKSINQDGNTIAFMQPIKLDEPTHIEVPVDQNGIVTGEIQKAKKDTKEQLAGAGHKTQDYLTEIDKLSDKKNVAGKLPESKASTKAGISKKAYTRPDQFLDQFIDKDKFSGDSGYPDHIYQKAFPPNKNVLQDGSIDEFAAATSHKISEFGERAISAIRSGKLDVNATDADGQSLLQVAVLRGEELPLIMWLVELGADINHVDNDGFNVFDYAVDKDEDVAKYFESLGLKHTQAYLEQEDAWDDEGDTESTSDGANTDGTDKNASAKSGLSKKAYSAEFGAPEDKKNEVAVGAGFSFKGFAKKAEDSTGMTGTIGNDSFNSISCGDGKKKTELEPAELVAAQKEIKDHEDGLEAA